MRWLRIFFCLGWLLGLVCQQGWAVQSAFAQTPHPNQDESCFKCHGNLYLLHDTGKQVCLCGTRARCSFCHGGVVGSFDMEVAHQNLIVNPITENRSVCQNCHPQDAQRRIAVFVAKAGVKTPQPLRPPAVAQLSAAGKTPSMLEEQAPAPWKTVAWSLIGLAAVGVLGLGWHCYRLDCLRKKFDPIA
jgi:hypothetical protein